MKRTHRGMTLIELLVATAGLVVVAGLALGIATESERATRGIARQQAALLYGQAAIDALVRQVRGAVDPSNLDHAALAGQLRFTEEELTLASYAEEGTPGLRLISFGTKPPTPEAPGGLQRHVRLLDPASGQVTQERHEPLVRQEVADFTPSLSFAYAAAAEPGQAVAWADQWSSPSLPRLIRITVDSALRDDKTTRSVRLETAVIPALAGGTR